MPSRKGSLAGRWDQARRVTPFAVAEDLVTGTHVLALEFVDRRRENTAGAAEPMTLATGHKRDGAWFKPWFPDSILVESREQGGGTT